MAEARRKILVTAALPYANGDIHLGHLVEYIQTDIWVRFQKMRGHECLYVCADDTHGTPIMIAANRKGISPEKLIADAQKAHLEDFAAFEVAFDHYGSTNSEENRELAERFFAAMKAGGHIASRSIRQSYCEKDGMFLPDRFVRGTCPRCGAEDQYGDSCDNCSSTYSPTDLVNARCSVCGTPPVERESEHLFFQLSHFQEFLQQWVREHTQKEIANKLQEWFADELRDWDISRDAPYFGFEIPGYPGKYFYVWLDAPVGYISSTEQWCRANGRRLEEFWGSPDTEIYHFIGKDIVYFHTLFWPAMLKTAGFQLPRSVFVHGFLKVNGEKMSKSKGTFINASTFRRHVDPMYLRYYYACKLSGSVEDVDLNFGDFINRVNSDLVGKITNVGSRGFQMLHKRLGGKLGKLPADGAALVKSAQERGEAIAGHFEARNYARALREIREIADEANRYFDEREPWKRIQEDPEGTREVLTTILNLFRLLAIYLKPVLPDYVAQVERLFREPPFTWESSRERIEGRTLEPFRHLAKRLEKEQVERIVEESKSEGTVTKSPPTPAPAAPAEDEGIIDITQFGRVDLRVARIVTAEPVEGADKLLKLTLDVGDVKKTVFAGIKAHYNPDQLTDRLVILVNNLKPRKMKFGLSEGMVLAASDNGTVRLLSADPGAKPGMKVS